MMVFNSGPTTHANTAALSDILLTSLAQSAVSEVAAPHGQVIDTWNVSGTLVSVTSAPGSTVTVRQAPTIQPPNICNNDVYSCLPSVNQPGVGLVGGVQPADDTKALNAVALAVSVQPPLMAKTAGNAELGAVMNTGMAEESRIIQSWCVDLNPNNGEGHAHACDVQRMDQDNGNGDWYLADEQEVTGNMKDMHRLYVYVEYKDKNNQFVHWSPNNWVPTGSCTTQTVTVPGISGSSYSESWTSCSDGYGPEQASSSQGVYPAFGAYWSSSGGSNDYQGVDAVDLVHNPSNACNCPVLWVGMSWGG